MCSVYDKQMTYTHGPDNCVFTKKEQYIHRPIVRKTELLFKKKDNIYLSQLGFRGIIKWIIFELIRNKQGNELKNRFNSFCNNRPWAF